MPRTVEQIQFAPRMPQPLRVAAYARVSSGKDAMLHSLAAQVDHYSTYIRHHHGWEYVGVYADEAKTGTKDSRENFQRMLTDCRAGKIDHIITKSISRFSRNTVTLLETVRELKELGISVYFEEQSIDTATADGELMLSILASYAQEESLSASENQKWRVKRNFEEGIPWRYRRENGKLAIVPEEAEIVRSIFDDYLAGKGVNAIAKRLKVSPAYLMGWEEQPTPKPTSPAPIPPGFEPMPKMKKIPLIGSIACRCAGITGAPALIPPVVGCDGKRDELRFGGEFFYHAFCDKGGKLLICVTVMPVVEP